MMSIAEQIFAEVRTLSDTQAREVPGFIGFLRTKQHSDRRAERQPALAELFRYRGSFKAAIIALDELYNRMAQAIR
jgi:hypothetical protein